MDSVHKIRYHLFNASFTEILKTTNHIQVTTLLETERNIMNLMELLNSQVSLGKHIPRPIDILSNTQILGLAVCVQTSVSVSTTIIMMDVDPIIQYLCTN